MDETSFETTAERILGSTALLFGASLFVGLYLLGLGVATVQVNVFGAMLGLFLFPLVGGIISAIAWILAYLALDHIRRVYIWDNTGDDSDDETDEEPMFQ